MDHLDPQIYFVQGLLHQKLGEAPSAIQAIESATRLRSAYAPYYLTLGALYLGAKRIKEAAEALDKATFLDPSKAKPFFSLALASFAAGDSALGKKAFWTFLKRAVGVPFRGIRNLIWFLSHWLVWILKGENIKFSTKIAKARTLVKKGDVPGACNILEGLNKTAPHNPKIALLYARQLNFCELPAKAWEVLSVALEENPGHLALLTNYAEILAIAGRTREGFEVLARVQEKHHNTPQYLKALGSNLYRDNRSKEAFTVFEKLEKMPGKKGEVYIFMARSFASSGDAAKAEAYFKKTIEQDTASGAAYIGLAKMGVIKPGDPLMKKLLDLTGSPSIHQKRRCHLNFAAGFAYEKAKDYDQAFYYFKRGNELRDVSFSPEAWVHFTKNIKKVFSGLFIKKLASYGNASAKPIFIVGMPRSGTSLTEQILAAHPDVFAGGEREAINIINYNYHKKMGGEFEWVEVAPKIGKADIAEMSDFYLEDINRIYPDAPRVTDKMPGNFWHVGLIHALFPEAKIIHCKRDPMDTCLSVYFQAFFTSHPYAFRLDNVGAYYKEYEKIMAYWHKTLPGKIFDFKYEETVSSPEKQIRALLKFCELDWDDNCLSFHKTETTTQTASFAQVGQPLYKSSSKKWKLYEKYLEDLKAALK